VRYPVSRCLHGVEAVLVEEDGYLVPRVGECSKCEPGSQVALKFRPKEPEPPPVAVVEVLPGATISPRGVRHLVYARDGDDVETVCGWEGEVHEEGGEVTCKTCLRRIP